MRLRLLGPLEVLDAQGHPVAVAGRKRRALLATLAVGGTVSVDRLIRELWGNTPPAGALNALQAHVGRLRRTMGAARVVTTASGYTLTAETDAAEFVSTVAGARTAADPIPVLRRALSLWRGPALTGCVLGDICAAEAAVLDEGRVAALEWLYDASLEAGRHREVLTELARTTAAHPLRERFYEQLIIALCRSGRRAEAARVYDRARHRLTTELGVEPGPTLRTLAAMP